MADRPAARPSIQLIGAVTVDLIMGQVPPWPRPGTETFVGHSELRPGGPAGNTALALKALGVPHRIFCNIGNDIFADWLGRAFGEAVAGLERVDTATAISVGVEHPGGERSFLTAAGNLAAQTVEGLLAMLPGRAVPGDIALATGVFLYPQLIAGFGPLLAEASARGYRVALDTGWPPGGWSEETRHHTASWLVHCDHVLFNEIEALSLSGLESVELAAGWMRARMRPDAVLVVKQGGDGASAWQGDARFHVPAPKVTVVDTIGAGDAFNAGYLAACLRGAAVEAAVRAGVEVASAAIASSPRRYHTPDPIGTGRG